ncbi:MAG TPA: hypothetical protein ENN67_00770 [Firmicutes bacterium]|nr:hypothetical protein [Bacillota bacterium]
MTENQNQNLQHPVHLLAIGNEILNGETRETNLSWLIRFFTKRGGNICHAAIVPDNFPDIKREIEFAIERRTELLITTGGLGPTDDDATLMAIGEALRRKMAMNEVALDMVRKRLEILAKLRKSKPNPLTKERKTMAVFPDGGEPLYNPVGVAPGMLLHHENLAIISVPGVPSEMKGIIKITLDDFWKKFFKGAIYVKRNIVISGIPEADLWPYIRKVNKLDPGIYIKTRLKIRADKTAEKSHPKYWIILHFSLIDSSRASSLRRIERLIESLLADLHKHHKTPYEVNATPKPHLIR